MAFNAPRPPSVVADPPRPTTTVGVDPQPPVSVPVTSAALPCGLGAASDRARAAATVSLTGWYVAKPCNHPGIDDTGTNVPAANVRGKSTGNAITCAVSLLGADRPMTANPHDKQ